MKGIKRYKFGFDIWGLLLFLAIMVPNFIWFAVPASNDVLRIESATATLDMVASVFQVIMVAALTLLVNPARKKPMPRPLFIGILAAILFYFVGWVFYYSGVASAIIVIDLTIAPCLAFILFCIARKNVVALDSAAVFTVCHLIHGVVNFLL